MSRIRTIRIDGELAGVFEEVFKQKGTWNDAVSITLGYNDFNHFKQTMLLLNEEELETLGGVK